MTLKCGKYEINSQTLTTDWNMKSKMIDVKKQKYNIWYHFIILSVVFFIEYLLFKSYAYREVIGKVPRNMDQIMFMQCSYELYDALIHRNMSSFLHLINVRIQTSGIPLIGALHLYLFGNSYFSFLLMNFFAFITAQITGSFAIYKITNKWTYVWMWTGLFASLKSPFYWAGDLLDFRADFIAFCLYTCWISIYLVFLESSENKYFKLSAVFAGMLIFCRMLSILYIGGALILFEMANIFIRHKKSIKRVIKEYCAYVGIMFVCGGWLTGICIQKFLSYYFLLHAATNDSAIRRMEQGVYTLWDNISFYPKSLIKDHLGGSICIFIVFCCVVASIGFLTGKMNIAIDKKILEILIFTTICILFPIMVLTADESKSSVVVNIVSGSIILAVVITIYMIFKQYFKMETLCFLICCCMGMMTYCSNSLSDRSGYSTEEQHGLMNLNNAIADYIIDNEKSETKMFVDRTLDGINAMTTRYWISTRDEMGHDVYDYTYNYNTLHNGVVKTTQVSEKPTEQEIEEQMERADIIVISKNGYGESLYITDNEIDKYRGKIWNYASDNLNLLTEDYAYGTWISVFVK